MKRIFLIGTLLITITLLTMGVFNFFKKKPLQEDILQTTNDNPYKNSSTNLVYNMLFCDDIGLYKPNTETPYSYPFNIIFSKISSDQDVLKIIDDPEADPRTKVLAYHKLRLHGIKPMKKELLAVIIEVGLDQGLDVLASFPNGTARYINHTEKILVWENTTDSLVNELTKQLFTNSQQVVDKIGPWDKPRRPHPSKGNTRITFLVSDGLYFGEAPTQVLFNDPLAAQALISGTQLMQCLTEKALEKEANHL